MTARRTRHDSAPHPTAPLCVWKSTLGKNSSKRSAILLSDDLGHAHSHATCVAARHGRRCAQAKDDPHQLSHLIVTGATRQIHFVPETVQLVRKVHFLTGSTQDGITRVTNLHAQKSASRNQTHRGARGPVALLCLDDCSLHLFQSTHVKLISFFGTCVADSVCGSGSSVARWSTTKSPLHHSEPCLSLSPSSALSCLTPWSRCTCLVFLLWLLLLARCPREHPPGLVTPSCPLHTMYLLWRHDHFATQPARLLEPRFDNYENVWLSASVFPGLVDTRHHGRWGALDAHRRS